VKGDAYMQQKKTTLFIWVNDSYDYDLIQPDKLPYYMERLAKKRRDKLWRKIQHEIQHKPPEEYDSS
jgi:hypothetical protein